MPDNTGNNGNNIIVNIEDEMKNSYLDYSMSVIIGRALPDVRDGLKPVHRRILYAMFREGLLSNRRFSKSAGVVGEVIKKYHPHGDSSVYDAMVRLAQVFNMRYPLVDGQGNFGSVDGDPAAAYRYTEARLMSIAEAFLADIDKDTVLFVPNFDEQEVQPAVLPTRVPNLLLNGSSGIAVGMATNIPPHNLCEIFDALSALMDNSDISIDELMEHVKGPDFPTGGILYGIAGIHSAYHTGRGAIRIRARVEFEDIGDREAIIIIELPYQVNKARLVEKIADLVKEKKIEGIADLRDESDRSGMRVVILLKRGENRDVLLNNLFAHTQMQSSFGIIMLTIIDNQPVVADLKTLLQCFIDHRQEVVRRRTVFELKKAEERAHILLGLKVALENLDSVIRLIRASQSPQDAKDGLMETFPLSAVQAQAILDMRLQRLTALESGKITNEYNELAELIIHYNDILGSEELIDGIIREELQEIREKHGDERRTEIVTTAIDFSMEDLISREEMVVTVSNTGYIKRISSSIYSSQRRGGKGKIGMSTKDDDFVVNLFIASTHDYILFFTDSGRMFSKKVYEVPEAGRATRGKSIVNLLELQDDEKVTAILPVPDFTESSYIIMATEQGVVKKTNLLAYSRARVNGLKAIVLDEGDKMICAGISDGNSEVVIGTSRGMVVRFEESDLRSIGRVCRGVRGIDLREGDRLIGMEVVTGDPNIFCITERGFGKRTNLSAFRKIRRGGKGVKGIVVNERNGKLMSIYTVDDGDELMVMSAEGKILRMKVADTKTIGRITQGVKIIDLGAKDYLTGVAKVLEKDDDFDDEDSDGIVAAADDTNTAPDDVGTTSDEAPDTPDSTED